MADTGLQYFLAQVRKEFGVDDLSEISDDMESEAEDFFYLTKATESPAKFADTLPD